MERRIQGNMDLIDAIVAMADGNPGAVRVMTEMAKQGVSIDQDHSLGRSAGIIHLDLFGIYGSRIWMLYKDVCGEDLTKTLAALRAAQMGLFSNKSLDALIDGKGGKVAVPDFLAMVQERLPRFGAMVPQHG